MTQWLVYAPGTDNNEMVSVFLVTHHLTPEETQVLDVRCTDGRKRDMFQIPGTMVRRIIQNAEFDFPQKIAFYTRHGPSFEARKASWLTKPKSSRQKQKMLERLEELQRESHRVLRANGEVA